MQHATIKCDSECDPGNDARLLDEFCHDRAPTRAAPSLPIELPAEELGLMNSTVPAYAIHDYRKESGGVKMSSGSQREGAYEEPGCKPMRESDGRGAANRTLWGKCHLHWIAR